MFHSDALCNVWFFYAVLSFCINTYDLLEFASSVSLIGMLMWLYDACSIFQLLCVAVFLFESRSAR